MLSSVDPFIALHLTLPGQSQSTPFKTIRYKSIDIGGNETVYGRALSCESRELVYASQLMKWNRINYKAMS